MKTNDQKPETEDDKNKLDEIANLLGAICFTVNLLLLISLVQLIISCHDH